MLSMVDTIRKENQMYIDIERKKGRKEGKIEGKEEGQKQKELEIVKKYVKRKI